MAQTADPDCKASIDRVDNIDEPSGPGDDTIDEPPGPGDDTIDGGDASPSSQNCGEGGTVNSGDAAPVTQESEQESESGEIDQSFEVS